MSEKKNPWYVSLASLLSYAIVLVAGVGLGYLVWGRNQVRAASGSTIAGSVTYASTSPIRLADREIMVVGTNSEATKVLNLTESSWLDVDVEELSGKNIEVAVMQDGRSLFRSGVHPRQVTGHVRALPGLCTVRVLNENMLDSKQVALSVSATRL